MRRTFALPAKRAGLSFAELAIVLAIVGILSCLGLAAAREARKKACRARAEGLLNYVYRMEVLHSGVQGRYTADMDDLRAMGLPEIIDPYYEFRIDIGDEGVDFACLAWANLDWDARWDTLRVDETGVIQLLAED